MRRTLRRLLLAGVLATVLATCNPGPTRPAPNWGDSGFTNNHGPTW